MTSPPDSALKVAEGRIVHDGAAAGAYFREVTEEGGEGIVLKNLNSRYGEVGAWVRLVKHVTYDGVVVDVIEGRGKFAGTLGKLVVEIDGPGGVRTKVTNFCDDERAEIWGNRAALVGRWVELRAKCKTAAGSLREPCFLRFREDKGTASTAKNAKSAKDGTA
jgi:ATP-dependent DNA ligase